MRKCPRFLFLALVSALAALQGPCYASGARAAGYQATIAEGISPELLQLLDSDEEILDLYCLKHSYPQVSGLEGDAQGAKWLTLKNGAKIPYSLPGAGTSLAMEDDVVPVAETMAMPYALEPARPDLPAGVSPGRKRNRAFLEAIYGSSAAQVGNGLKAVPLRGKKIRLSAPAADALAAAIPAIEQALAKNPSLAPYLKPEGGFYWRKIAGENRLSAHSYGIALDIGVNVSPYWRWAKVMPHPKQRTYPGEIVKAMEDKGFIWGGKWHEYDLMHFEYRPELICKAQIKALFNAKQSKAD